MASRLIGDLAPKAQELAKAFIARMQEAKLPFIITCTYRSQLEQDELYKQGRTKPGRVVTWTRNSNHTRHIAFDIAIMRENSPIWDVKADVNDNEIPDYTEAGTIGESVGLVWGGRFKKPDYPHFELPKDLQGDDQGSNP